MADNNRRGDVSSGKKSERCLGEAGRLPHYRMRQKLVAFGDDFWIRRCKRAARFQGRR